MTHQSRETAACPFSFPQQFAVITHLVVVKFLYSSSLVSIGQVRTCITETFLVICPHDRLASVALSSPLDRSVHTASFDYVTICSSLPWFFLSHQSKLTIAIESSVEQYIHVRIKSTIYDQAASPTVILLSRLSKSCFFASREVSECSKGTIRPNATVTEFYTHKTEFDHLITP